MNNLYLLEIKYIKDVHSTKTQVKVQNIHIEAYLTI